MSTVDRSDVESNQKFSRPWISDCRISGILQSHEIISVFSLCSKLNIKLRFVMDS